MKLDQLPMPAPQLLMGIEAFMVNLPFIEIPPRLSIAKPAGAPS